MPFYKISQYHISANEELNHTIVKIDMSCRRIIASGMVLVWFILSIVSGGNVFDKHRLAYDLK